MKKLLLSIIIFCATVLALPELSSALLKLELGDYHVSDTEHRYSFHGSLYHQNYRTYRINISGYYWPWTGQISEALSIERIPAPNAETGEFVPEHPYEVHFTTTAYQPSSDPWIWYPITVYNVQTVFREKYSTPGADPSIFDSLPMPLSLSFAAIAK